LQASECDAEDIECQKEEIQDDPDSKDYDRNYIIDTDGTWHEVVVTASPADAREARRAAQRRQHEAWLQAMAAAGALRHQENSAANQALATIGAQIAAPILIDYAWFAAVRTGSVIPRMSPESQKICAMLTLGLCSFGTSQTLTGATITHQPELDISIAISRREATKRAAAAAANSPARTTLPLK
jgi:hypothetical protein